MSVASNGQPGPDTRCLTSALSVILVAIITLFASSCHYFDQKSDLFGRVANQAIWPHDRSDISPDREVEFGRLDNGLRYIIRQNQTPRDRVSLHLYVSVGSLFENDEEQGIAHYLEHMLFNGTRHFPPGEMVKYFQRIGMQFGGDANAHTGFDQTVYDVVLPKGDQKSLSEGLLVLRDYADGALLLPEETERERNVILAEKRSRDSAAFRTLKAALRFELPGLKIGNRFPIGETETIEKIDNRMLRHFYETWYRPERMFLVLVGDLDKKAAAELVAEKFGDIKPVQPESPLPHIGHMTHDGINGFYHYEKDAGATSVSIETVGQHVQPQDSRSYQLRQMVVQLTDTMMQRRLDADVRRKQTVLTSADSAAGYYLEQIKYAQISGDTSPENWQKAVFEIEQVLRKALRYGFTSAELRRAKNDLSAMLIKAQREAKTRDSNKLAREILASIEEWRVLQSPDQRADALLPELEKITLEQVNHTFAEIWSAKHRLVLVTGNAILSSGPTTPREQVVAAYAASHQLPVKPPEEKRIAEFPYLAPPASSGVILQKEELKDLGITRVLFANGIHLMLKPTPFKENQILAALSFGNGQASEPIDQPGLAKLAQAVINESGFGAMDRIELEAALNGRLAHIDFETREDLFLVKGESSPKELPLLFQLLNTFVRDTGYRQEARQLVLKQFEQAYQEQSKSVDGVLRLQGQKFLAGGDTRFGEPEWEQLHRRTLQQVKTWMDRQLHHTPMELALAGDFDVDQVIDLASRYLGTLPKRPDASSFTPMAGPVFPQGKSLTLPVQTETPKALVVVAYPTEDFWDIQRTRRLSLLAELISERLRQQIREKLGAAYSPYAYNRSYRAYQGYGLTQIFVQVNPKLTHTIVDEIRRIADQLRTTDAQADEFRRVLDPILTHIKDLRQKNTYWINSVLIGAARHPEQLAWARSFESDYAAIRIDEISALARKYLANANAATLILTPDGATPQE